MVSEHMSFFISCVYLVLMPHSHRGSLFSGSQLPKHPTMMASTSSVTSFFRSSSTTGWYFLLFSSLASWKACWVFSNRTVMSSTQAVLALLLMNTMSGLSSVFSCCLLTATSQSSLGRAATIWSWMMLCRRRHAAECILQWQITWGRETLEFYNRIKVGWSREEYVLEGNNKRKD